MSCRRGKASPDTHTRLRLFSDSGGLCQKPDCRGELFQELGTRRIHIAEIAHVFSASDDGPRADRELTEDERGAYENLILLCPTCHTVVDKAPDVFTDPIILEWKRTHRDKIREVFGIREYSTRAEARDAIRAILRENRTIFETYGPETDEQFDPESEVPGLWRRKVLEKILPNNNRLLRIIDANSNLLTPDEQATLELFRQHQDDLTARHASDGEDVAGGIRFPKAMARMLVG